MAIDVMTEPGKTLKRLADKLAARQSRLRTLSDWQNGNAPLPDVTKAYKAAYLSIQEKARMNLAPVIVQAPKERMVVAGFRVGDAAEFDKEAWRIWTMNEMGSQAPEVHGDMLGLVWGYAIVGEPDETGVPVITREDPRQCITEHNPLRRAQVTAALKMYRDEVREKDYAYLYLPGQCFIASRSFGAAETVQQYDVSAYDWDLDEWVNDGNLSVPVVPVVAFENAGPLPGIPMGEFEPHIETLRRINETSLHRLVVTTVQAFRQRAILGELPEKDEDGNVINYAEVFIPHPGALWRTNMPPSEAQIWESQSTDISSLLNAIKDDVRVLAAETATPLPMLQPDAQNQSAEGVMASTAALVKKVIDREARAGYGWNTVMKLAFAFAGHPVANVETEWMNPELVSLAEKADAYSKVADMPFETKLREVMQYPPDKVARILQERFNDAFSATIAAPVSPNGV